VSMMNDNNEDVDVAKVVDDRCSNDPASLQDLCISCVVKHEEEILFERKAS